VGHTHELIDQLFACFAIWLKTHDVLTYQQFQTDLKGTYYPAVQVEKLQEVGDWTRFLKAAGVKHDMHKHTGFRSFLIRKNSRGMYNCTAFPSILYFYLSFLIFRSSKPMSFPHNKKYIFARLTK
jgi:hypothetical protein